MADQGLNQKIGNRYHLLENIGQGGMGVVYRTRDQLTGQIIALKRMLVVPNQPAFTSQVSTDDFAAARVALATEFRTLAGLRHPHIVGVLDYGFTHDETAPQPYFTMHYLDNPQTLTEYAQKLPIQEKIQVLVDMLLALAYLHRRDIIHRDLKPGNVLVAADGIVKVMDFGLALNQQQSDPEVLNGMVGTLAYMAPELFSGGAPSLKSDLYAAGLIAYETLTGKLPFITDNPITMVQDIVHQSPDTSGFDAPLARVFDRLLAKQPADRYSSADEVIEALCAAVDQPLPQENSALRESFLQAAQFVGRAAELKCLTTALDQTIENRGSTWLIGGESGAGKSRLLDELRTRALVAGALVLRGQAVEGGGLPYQLWREPLRLLVLAGDITDVEAGILKEIVPDIATLLERPIADVAAMDGRVGQQRLGQTITSLIRRQKLPLVLLLEDLQWASEGLTLLKQLYTQVGELPLLIVGTYRSDDAPTLPADLPNMETIQLARLSDSAIADLSASMLGDAGKSPAVVDLLRRETEGNAFFMVEVVRALAEDAGSLQEIGRITLPEQVFAGGVKQVVQRRLNRVPANLHSLLQLAAVIGRQPDAVLLHHLVNSAAELEQFLTVSSHAAVLEPVSGDERWRFSHDKIREFILSQLTQDERKLLHRKVAEALEAVHPGDEAYAGVLVEHWRQAENVAKETHYALLAAGQMFRTGNLAGARALLERVVKLPGGEAEHAAILKTLGDIYERMGDYPQAVETYERGLKLAKTPLENGRLLIGLSWVKWQTGDAAQAKTYAEQGLELCRQANDERGISRIFGILGILAAESEDFGTAQDYFKQGLNLQQQINDQRGVSVSYQNLGQLALMQGDFGNAQTHLQQSIALQRAMGDLRGLEGSLQNLASLYLGQKQFDQVRPVLREALAIAREMAAAPYLLHGVLAAADLYLVLGDPEQASVWMALVAAHPACNEEIRQKIKPLQQKLEALPDGSALLEEGRQQAENLDLDLAIDLIETML